MKNLFAIFTTVFQLMQLNLSSFSIVLYNFITIIIMFYSIFRYVLGCVGFRVQDADNINNIMEQNLTTFNFFC